MENSKTFIISRISLICSIVSIVLFLSSLTQNTYFIEDEKASVGSFGLVALLLGWMAIAGPGIAWLANPLLLASIALNILKKRIVALISVLGALAFALSFMTFKTIIANEGGSTEEITGYDTGYWLWISSISVNLLGIILSFIKTSGGDGN